jgi:hypothetical protein
MGKILSTKQQNVLEQLFQFKQKTLLKVMDNYLRQKYDSEKVITTKDYIIAIGDIPVALVAHMDTVFEHPPTDIYYDTKKNIMISPQGLGADDRAGVFAITQILKKKFKPTIIFTTDEEKGATGALKLTVDYPAAPTNLNYIIQLDRRGEKDCVFYDCDNSDFEKYVNSFGFETNWGSFSDISVICPAWGIAGVNLSIGYFHEHTKQEILCIDYTLNTIDRVIAMLNDAENSVFYKYIEAPQYTSIYGGSGKYYDYGWGYDDVNGLSYFASHGKCKCCNKYFEIDNMYPVETLNGEDYYCIDCLSSDKVSWCAYCGDPFVPEKEGQDICNDCEETILKYDKH